MRPAREIMNRKEQDKTQRDTLSRRGFLAALSALRRQAVDRFTRSPAPGSLGAQVFATHRDTPEWQLYGLQNDPYEFHNLAGQTQHAAVETRLRAQLVEWRTMIKDPLLDPVQLTALTKMHDESDKRFGDGAHAGAATQTTVGGAKAGAKKRRKKEVAQ